MGEVFLAEDLDLKRKVALKILPREVADEPDRLARFRREAESLAALNHPNIVTIYSIEQADDLHILTMEWVKGRGLEQLLSKQGLPLDQLLEMAVSLSDALEAAHEKGITHRDLKPANLMLTEDGRLKVLDFGLAKFRREGQSRTSSDRDASLLTREEMIIGTPPYMSPEQIEGGDVDGRSDLFSAGIVLYELASGQRPFLGRSSAAVMSAILSQTPSPIRQLRKDLPPELERILSSCLQKEPVERYQTALDLKRDLQTLRNDSGDRVGGKVPNLQGARLFLVVAGLTLIAGLSVWQAWFAGSPSERIGIAVMPFDNKSASEDAWFAAAITQGVADRLSSVEGLIVRRPPVHWKERTPEEIRTEIGVDYVLRAEVFLVDQGESRQVIVTPELTLAIDGSLAGSSTLRRAIPNNDELFEVHRSLANQILEGLSVGPRGLLIAEAAASPTQNTEALNHYLKGNYFYGKRDEASLKKAAEHYEQAVELDDGFALAYAGLAAIPGTRAWYGLLDPASAYEQSKQATEMAVAAGPDLPQVVVMTTTLHPYYLDTEEAVRAFRRAIDLSRSLGVPYPTAHQWLSYPLSWAGRDEEAIQTLMVARELDPVSPIISTWLGLTHFFFRRYEEAMQWMDQALELDPNFVPVLWHRSWVCGVSGKYAEALSNAEKLCELAPDNPTFQLNLAWAYALDGRQDDARALLSEMVILSQSRYLSKYHMAAVHVALGENDAAFRHLDEAMEEKAWWRGAMNVDQRFLPLRGDPRYAALLPIK